MTERQRTGVLEGDESPRLVEEVRPTAQLVVLGPGSSQVVPVNGSPITLGSDLGNEVVLQGGNVSPHHCSIVPVKGGGHRLLGLETYQDLVLNGRAIDEAQLEPFDRFEFGGYVVVYLPIDVDALYVQSLLATPDAATCRLRLRHTERDHMRERLLWLLLMLQSLPPGAPIDPVLDLILQEVRRWSGFTSVALLVRRGEGDLEPLKILQGERARTTLSHDELESCRDLVEQAVTHRRAHEAHIGLTGFEFALCLPVSNVWSASHERRRFPIGLIEGALLLGSTLPTRAPGPEALGLLRALTRQVAILLGNVRVFRQATVDHLTGLASRACSQRVLEEELERARVLRGSLACLVLDVDDFKSLNDTYGHLVGDEVLTHLSSRLRGELRGDDFACRWGGEEFLVVLPGTDLDGACSVADKIVRNVTWHQFRRGGPRVSVSVGVAVFPDHAERVADLVDRADKALYVAKRSGKARYAVYRPEGASDASTDPGTVSSAAAAGHLWLQHPLIEPFLLRPGRISLGRSGRADVCLYHPKVSREHGVIEVDGAGRATYVDCSSNGTLLNHQPVEGKVELAVGDQLTVGPFDLVVTTSPVSAAAATHEDLDPRTESFTLPKPLLGPTNGSRS